MAVGKSCTRCKLVLDLSAFGKNRTKPDGLQSNCKPCTKKVNRDYYQRTPEKNPQRTANKVQANRRAKEFIYGHLAENPCVDCGEADIVVLDFDHVRGEKCSDISIMVRRGLGLQTIAAEVEKCEVRCANCHRRVTAKRAGWARLAHGRIPAVEC